MAAVASSSSSTLAPSSSTSRLEPLLLLARSTKPRGAAAANLIHQAIAAPGVFFFGELFDVPGVAELASPSDSASSQLQAAYQLLCLFTYGMYSDYVHLVQSGGIAELSRVELQKLRQLTLLSLAYQHKSLPYATLHASLGIDSTTRELEDLIIETVYAGLVSGKLNELQARFEVHHVQGRDVPHPERLVQPALQALPSVASGEGGARLEGVYASLHGWQATTVSLLASLQARMDSARASAADSEQLRQQHHQALLNNLVEAQQQIEAQQEQQQRKGKAAANAMEIDEDNSRAAARKEAAVGGARGNKRSRA